MKPDGHALCEQASHLAGKAGLEAIAVAARSHPGGDLIGLNEGRWFHAASTMKVAVLYALLRRAADGHIRLDAPLHVRNRFQSIVGGGIFRVASDRDGDSSVHEQIGKTMPLSKLADAMITRSSNLATNLLIDFLGVPEIRRTLAVAGVEGLEIVRGVEDEAAFEAGLNNRATAQGLLSVFELFLDEAALPANLRQTALEILLRQEFNQMIPAGLPDGIRVAHKTGEITAISHDAGIILPENGNPYVLAILTEGGGSAAARREVIAKVAGVIHEFLTQ